MMTIILLYTDEFRTTSDVFVPIIQSRSNHCVIVRMKYMTEPIYSVIGIVQYLIGLRNTKIAPFVLSAYTHIRFKNQRPTGDCKKYHLIKSDNFKFILWNCQSFSYDSKIFTDKWAHTTGWPHPCFQNATTFETHKRTAYMSSTHKHKAKHSAARNAKSLIVP